MNTIVEFCIIPLGVGVSLSEYVAACERILEDEGLEFTLHANGTNIEGDWDAVMGAVKKCHQRVHEMGAPRISSSLRVGTRIDRVQTLSDKIESVQSKMKGEKS
ncbi:MAG: MTH1187 family thiamine-binding protein [Acidobacteriota bacterium]